MKLFYTLLFSFVFSFCAKAQLNTAKLDSLMHLLDKHHKFMGAVAISKQGQLLYHKEIGFLNVEKNMTAKQNTRYHIGSVSKMFTAVMIQQLIEEGKLKEESTLDLFFPSIPNSKSITILQLLNHSSGLFNFTRDTNYLSYCSRYHSDEELISLFSKFPSSFEPGTSNEYCNTAYVLLSMIIEKVTGHTYNSELQQRITQKLNLRHTMVSPAIASDPSIAYSYSWEEPKWVKEMETDMSIPKGAGALLSTPEEMCLFIQGLFQGKLLSEKSLKRMTTIEKKYGLGIFEFPFGKRKALGHNGAIDGFKSILGYFPDDSITFALTANGIDMEMNDILLGILQIAYNKPYTLPSFEKPVLSDAAKKTIYGKYLNGKMNMAIRIYDKDGIFTAEAEGQSPIAMKKVSDVEYTFEPAGVVLRFVQNTKKEYEAMKLIQAGHELLFDKVE